MKKTTIALGIWLLSSLPGAASLDVPQAPAPVSSVNGAQGAVVVPTVQRQVSSALDISSGAVTWSFPNSFSNQPTCWISVASTNTNYVFAAPLTTAISTSAVTVSEQAALKALTISLGALTVWGNPPSGTTVTLSCVGALP